VETFRGGDFPRPRGVVDLAAARKLHNSTWSLKIAGNLFFFLSCFLRLLSIL